MTLLQCAHGTHQQHPPLIAPTCAALHATALLCCQSLQLVHIAISPHNAAFYKLLDELWSEAEDLMDRGISGSGQGFDAPSAGRLGSHAFIPMHNPPEHKMADAIRKVGTQSFSPPCLHSHAPVRRNHSRW
jgi:hypothetical protein